MSAALELLPAVDRRLPERPALAVRIIRPRSAARAALLHIHGGGFAFGNSSMEDEGNSALASTLGIATVSVDYRLAPAHPHPAALEDCEAAALWLIAHAAQELDTERLLIGGESVGAGLSVLTLLRLRERHDAARRFCGASLVAGGFDFSMTPSQRASSDALFLSPARLRATVAAAFPGRDAEQLRDPGISALYADLRGLPPAIFTVGTADAVLDDSLFMAARWRAAGNVTQLEVYEQATHLFLREPTAMAAEARRRIARFLAGCYASV
jgi:acetyl esterase/lipase